MGEEDNYLHTLAETLRQTFGRRIPADGIRSIRSGADPIEVLRQAEISERAIEQLFPEAALVY